MIGAGKNVRVFLYRAPCDMRRQMDGLSTMVREELRRDPETGDLFVFRNRRGDLVKLLFYDQLGCCLLAKRLHKGSFRVALTVPDDAVSIELTREELAALLSRAEILERAAQAA
jgi:transposase